MAGMVLLYSSVVCMCFILCSLCLTRARWLTSVSCGGVVGGRARMNEWCHDQLRAAYLGTVELPTYIKLPRWITPCALFFSPDVAVAAVH
jgi:hypothetical protein